MAAGQDEQVCEEYQELLDTVKECKRDWITFCERYNDPNVDFEDLGLW